MLRHSQSTRTKNNASHAQKATFILKAEIQQEPEDPGYIHIYIYIYGLGFSVQGSGPGKVPRHFDESLFFSLSFSSSVAGVKLHQPHKPDLWKPEASFDF